MSISILASCCDRLDISPSPSIRFDGRTPALDMTYRYFALFVHFWRRRLELLNKRLLLCCHGALSFFCDASDLGPSCRGAFTVWFASLWTSSCAMAVSFPPMTSQSWSDSCSPLSLTVNATELESACGGTVDETFPWHMPNALLHSNVWASLTARASVLEPPIHENHLSRGRTLRWQSQSQPLDAAPASRAAPANLCLSLPPWSTCAVCGILVPSKQQFDNGDKRYTCIPNPEPWRIKTNLKTNLK